MPDNLIAKLLAKLEANISERKNIMVALESGDMDGAARMFQLAEEFRQIRKQIIDADASFAPVIN